jgi:predicted phosphodiesterase
MVPDRYSRIALMADVHGNVSALAACLDEAMSEHVDAVAFLGCLTWGPEPAEVLRRVHAVTVPTYFIRGNGERAVLELAGGARAAASSTDTWMVSAHGAAGLQALRSFALSVSLEVAGVGRIRLCHGSPRSDIELLTPATPEHRLQAAFDGVDEPVVAHGHTHLQYLRVAAGKTIVGVGSVGLPYTDGPPVPDGRSWPALSSCA